MGKKRHDIHVKLDDRQMETLARVARAMGYETVSDAVRNIIRLADILFDDKLTIEVAFQPFFLDTMLNDEEFRKRVPLIHMIKTIPNLERELNAIEPPPQSSRFPPRSLGPKHRKKKG